MFGVTTPCVNAVKERLAKEGYETMVFHATGVGGRAMENLVREGLQVYYFIIHLRSMLRCKFYLRYCIS
jgi:uncharacterized protein (UPF0261 family)